MISLHEADAAQALDGLIEPIGTRSVGRNVRRMFVASCGPAILPCEACNQARSRDIDNPRATADLVQEGRVSMISPRKATGE